jgi:multiple sugar transport system substrate-binding protein
MDGEWRNAIIKDDKSSVHFAAAPLPVPDDQVATYGKGFLTGTVIGISSRSTHQQAAWELTKFLTTDTDALVSFGNAIQNLPSTTAALKSPDLSPDPVFKTFLDISANAQSGGTPPSSNGGEYLTILGRYADKWESGALTDLPSMLADADKQIDAANAQSGH